MLDGDSRKTKRAKDRTETGLEECHSPESSPCISTQYPLLSSKIIERMQGKPQEGRGRHKHNKQMCRLACAQINPPPSPCFLPFICQYKETCLCFRSRQQRRLDGGFESLLREETRRGGGK